MCLDEATIDTNMLISQTKLKKLINDLIPLAELSVMADSNINQLTELSQGNVNQVFRVILENGFSFIAKYAPPFAYRYQEIAINSQRNCFEAEVLKHLAKAKKDAYPEVYYFSNQQHLMLMEDLNDCLVMRDALIEGDVFEHFKVQAVEMFKQYADNIPDSETVQRTTISYQEGIFELQEITRLFVFECPFGLDYPNGICMLEGHHSWIKHNIFDNTQLQAARTRLQEIYNTKHEALIHGDLHTGSIMLNHNKMKVIDPEFAKIGPISFDIGMLLANLLMNLIASNYHLKNDRSKQANFQLWLSDSISYIYHQSIKALADLGFDVLQLKAEIIGFCAIEIIRRTIGAVQIKDFLSINSLKSRQSIEKIALMLALEQLSVTQEVLTIEASLALVSKLVATELDFDV
ncbi:phosphotransferase [Thiotrichales bacterium 19S3-7]|nr:phosphotransferase [Thiotrichales bacterium 19S3-7]MCF6800622.1 phosphotransferase [Thiotrichales bacterium 19S3-11]